MLSKKLQCEIRIYHLYQQKRKQIIHNVTEKMDRPTDKEDRNRQAILHTQTILP